jgi:hypothetical protein
MKLSTLDNRGARLYLRVAAAEKRQTRQGAAMVHLKLADASATLPAVVFEEHACFEAAANLRPGQVVAVSAALGSYQGQPRLEIDKLRALDDRDEGLYDPAQLFGPALARVRDLTARVLVVDIETAPLVDVRTLPPTLVEEVTRVAKDKEWPIDKVLALNPLFSRVVSVAVGDATKDGGTVMLAPDASHLQSLAAQAPSWLRPMAETDMLASFWALAAAAEGIVTFNGRSFDLPFLRTRSAILGIAVTYDLLSQKPYEHWPHLDLYALLSGGSGFAARPMNLEAACFAFGIDSPKGEMDGSMIAQAFHDQRYQDIARYNLADVEATRALFHRLKSTVLDHMTS